MVRERKCGERGGATKVGENSTVPSTRYGPFALLLGPREQKTYEYAGDVGLNELRSEI